MADFCIQCAGDIGAPSDYPPDFLGSTKFGDQMAGLFALVLCEGCGPIQVDWLGRCISPDCYEHHESPIGAPAKLAELTCEAIETARNLGTVIHPRVAAIKAQAKDQP